MPDKKSNVAALFHEIRYGNKHAFDELFASHHDKLLVFAKQFINAPENAEEIVSELFVKLWIRRERLLSVLNPEVYLYVCVKNACLNLLRADKRRSVLFFPAPAEESVERSIRVNSLEDKELLGLLNRAVDNLPEQRRIIYKLIKDHGLKARAVAEILGISTRTVESQLYKAVKSLADAISGYLGYHPQAKK